TYGYAAVRAYLAYANSTFLQYAIQSWSFGRSYTLSQGVTEFTGKNFTVIGTCAGATMAGGTFEMNTLGDPGIAAMSTGYFMLLSAVLAEATNSNPTYLNAAIDSANFIHSHLYNDQGLVLQAISGNQNDSCKILEPILNSFNSGLFIEALAVLVSQTHDSMMQTWLNDLITDVLSNPTWQNGQGIIANGDAILVRALRAAYLRNTTTPEIRDTVRDYIAVQFNAVLDLATNGDNVYAAKWTGPPSSTFSENSQTGALSPLLSAAMVLAQDSNSTSSSPNNTSSSPPTSSSSSPSKHSTGLIAGVTIAVLAVLIAVAIFIFMRRRFQARRKAVLVPTPMSQPAIFSSGFQSANFNPSYVSNAAALSSPSFADPSTGSSSPVPASPPHPAGGTDFSFLPRSYAAGYGKGRLGRPPARHVQQQPSMSTDVSGTTADPLTSPGSRSGSENPRVEAHAPGEEPPPLYVS
ncbi:hypothetical protein R3P38DRAFT_3576479, partial [Favolaschia claudopus]